MVVNNLLLNDGGAQSTFPTNSADASTKPDMMDMMMLCDHQVPLTALCDSWTSGLMPAGDNNVFHLLLFKPEKHTTINLPAPNQYGPRRGRGRGRGRGKHIQLKKHSIIGGGGGGRQSAINLPLPAAARWPPCARRFQ